MHGSFYFDGVDDAEHVLYRQIHVIVFTSPLVKICFLNPSGDFYLCMIIFEMFMCRTICVCVCAPSCVCVCVSVRQAH